MDNELEMLLHLRTDFYINKPVKYDSFSYFTSIEKALMAIQLIREKPRGIYLVILTGDYEDYLMFFGKHYDFMYEKEEYYLLKDVLTNIKEK